MTFRLSCATLAAACALAALPRGVAVAGDTVPADTMTLSGFSVTTTYLASYQITVQGTNVVVDTYDVSGSCSYENLLGFCFDIGNGNLYGVPSVDSPFQVWGLWGPKAIVKTTVGDDTAGEYLSTSDDTYYADTHIMTVLDISGWDTETNNACYASGTTTGAYQIGVGSLDYEAVDWESDATTATMDLANVGIVRGTTVSAYVALAGVDSTFVQFPTLTFPGSPQSGDANGDGSVDINDLTIVLTNYGQTGCAWSQGCMDGDPTGTVDINDLTIVLSNYGDTLGAPSPATVPEPSAILLAATALAALAACAGRKHPRRPRTLR
jgi:hypothetical protein